MAIDDEIIRLILDLATNARDVQEVVDKLNLLKGSTQRAADTYEILERQVGEYEVMERRVAVAQSSVITTIDHEVEFYQRLITTVDQANVRIDQSTMSHTALAGQGGPGGRGILAASYAFQDFTSQINNGVVPALGAVQNNIPGILAGLGIGGGIAGAVSAVSVGIGLLYANWDKIAQLWGAGHTEAEIERLKNLKTATEEAEQATKKLLETLNPEQKRAQSDTKRAVDAFGGKAVLEEVKRALIRERGSFGAEADNQMAQNLIGGAARGDLKADQYLKQITSMFSEIGGVIHGGATPEERKSTPATDALEKSAEEFRRKAKEAKDSLKKEVDDLVKEYEEWSGTIDVVSSKEANTKREKGIAETRKLSNQIAQAMKNRGKQDFTPDKKLSPIDPNATNDEIQAVMINNQAILMQQAARDRELLLKARQVQRGLENGTRTQQNND